ncbi:hypothetical protein D9613_003115 [Agrocybe pediades]|uniref:Proteasome assembly chaperone 3 n=1 Tax=Agrocybe pediades TaxID=84607 RepID=A0A8H4QQ05_9AGAR|nr:hypothetical protein D9613_003115 [Agrocybe pediades]
MMTSLTPRQTCRNLNGKDTHVFIQTFADRVLVLVTQLGKVGNLIQATLPETAPLLPSQQDPSQPNKIQLPEPSPAIQLTPLLGGSPSPHLQDLYSLYASQIATIIWTEESKVGLEGIRRGVVVGLALYKQGGGQEDENASGEREVFEGVMEMVYDLLQSGSE